MLLQFQETLETLIAEARGLVELHVHITSIRDDKGRSGLLRQQQQRQ